MYRYLLGVALGLILTGSLHAQPKGGGHGHAKPAQAAPAHAGHAHGGHAHGAYVYPAYPYRYAYYSQVSSINWLYPAAAFGLGLALGSGYSSYGYPSYSYGYGYPYAVSPAYYGYADPVPSVVVGGSSPTAPTVAANQARFQVV